MLVQIPDINRVWAEPPLYSPTQGVFLFVLRGFLTSMSIIGVSHFCFSTGYLIAPVAFVWGLWRVISTLQNILTLFLGQEVVDSNGGRSLVIVLLSIGWNNSIFLGGWGGKKKGKKWSHHVLGMELSTLNTKFFILWFIVSKGVQNVKKKLTEIAWMWFSSVRYFAMIWSC